MSGGSFEYLFTKLTDEEDAFSWSASANLQAMADDAAAEGFTELAETLNELGAQIRIARARVLGRGRTLSDVIRAYEWWRSMDYSREQVQEAWDAIQKGSKDE